MSLLFKCRPNEMRLAVEKRPQTQLSMQSLQFTPPRPYYTIEADLSSSKADTPYYKKVKFVHSLIKEDNIPPWMKATCYSLHKGKKDNIIVLYIENSINISKGDNKLTIIYSHNGESDLGTLYPHLFDLSLQFKMNVIAYDYSGYGRSLAKSPSRDSLMKDIELVLNFAFKELGIKKEQLVIYGEDIGIVPSVLICSKIAYKNVYGMILASMLLINELVNGMFNCVSCPVYIIHPKKKVNSEGIKAVCEQFKNKQLWFPNVNTFEHIISQKRAKFYFKINSFFTQVGLMQTTNINDSLCSEFRISAHLRYDCEEEESDTQQQNYKKDVNMLSSSSSNRVTGFTDIHNNPNNYMVDDDSDLSYEGSL